MKYRAILALEIEVPEGGFDQAELDNSITDEFLGLEVLDEGDVLWTVQKLDLELTPLPE